MADWLIEIIWVKAHNNNTGNEFADHLARKGAEETAKWCGPLPYWPIKNKTLYNMVHNHFLTVWQENWEDPKQKDFCKITNSSTRKLESKNI